MGDVPGRLRHQRSSPGERATPPAVLPGLQNPAEGIAFAPGQQGRRVEAAGQLMEACRISGVAVEVSHQVR